MATPIELERFTSFHIEKLTGGPLNLRKLVLATVAFMKFMAKLHNLMNYL